MIVDVDDDWRLIDVARDAHAVGEGQAIVLAHLYGVPVDIVELVATNVNRRWQVRGVVNGAVPESTSAATWSSPGLI